MTFKIFILKLLTNKVLAASLAAWIFALLLKGTIISIKQKKMSVGNFIGAGGMPSSHTALVAALVTGVGLKEGWHGTLTAITCIFALIVMYDSSGVRFAAGQQATTLNKIVAEIFKDRAIDQRRLRESLGHNLTEVIVGAVLGALIALMMFNF